MAKKVVDEQIKLSIIIDGNEAQKELNDLSNSTRELRESNKLLLVEKQKLEKQGKKETEAYKTVTATIRENNRILKENKNRTKELQDQIGITALTMTQLRSRASQLRIQLNNAIPGSADYIRYQNELKQVSARMDELRGKARATGLTLGKVADGFNRYAALAASVIATLTGMALSIQKILDYNGKLSDSQSDVMKTTNLTKKEVDELTKSFGLLKTRTARIELLKLAEEAGRLGIEGKENVEAFVRVANQLKIALGDDLNDTQIRDVGKLVELYKVAEETGRDLEGSLLSLGSAINEVSASGSNQAGYLVDFLKRTGGISAQVKLSAADNIGYAATFDELGQNVEVTGTVMNKIWMDMAKNTKSYAKITNMSITEFKNLMEKDANQAMITFLKALKNNNAGFTEMVKLLDDVEAGGARGDAALSALVDGVDKLEEKQAIANASLLSATSLTDEYNIKNNNLAATLDKIKQKVVGWYSSDTFVKWLTDAVNWFARFIGATEDASGEAVRFRDKLVQFIKVFAVITVSWLSYNTAVKLATLSIKDFTTAKKVLNVIKSRWLVLGNLSRVLLLRLKLAYFIVRKQTENATRAQLALNAAQAANPLGLLLALLGGLAAYLLIFKRRTDDAAGSQKSLNAEMQIASEYQKNLGESTTDLKSKIDPLIKILNDENTSLEVRKLAYEKLIGIHPGFVGTVDEEFRATEKLTDSYTKLIEKLEEVALAKARQSVREKLATAAEEAKLAELNAKLKSDKEEEENEARKKRNEELAKEYLEAERFNTKDPGRRPTLEGISTAAAEAYENAQIAAKEAKASLDEYSKYQKSELDKLQEKLKTLEEGSEAYKKVLSEIESWMGPTNKTETIPPSGGGGTIPLTSDKEASNQEREHQRRLNEIEKFHNERLRQERAFEDDYYTLMDDGFDKEMQILETQHQRKIEDLTRKKIAQQEIDKALEEANNEKLSKEQRQSFADLAAAWVASNKNLNAKIEQETDLHLLRKRTLIAKHSVDEIKVLEQNYEREKVLRETQLNEELLALGDNEKAKEELKAQYAKIELEKEQEKIEAMIRLYQEMIAGAEIDGLDFSLLPPDKIAEFEKNIEHLRKLMSDLNLEKEKLAKAKADQKGEGKINLGAKTDIFGFSEDEWETLFDNLKKGEFGITSWAAALMAVENAWNTFAPQVDNLMKAQEDSQLKRHDENARKKENRLKLQLNRGIISQDQYNKAVEAIENDLNKKKAELEYKQAKRKKKIDTVSTIMNTATGIMKAYADLGPIAGTVAAVIIGAMGALQIATIAKQPLPSVSGFEHGLYQDYMVKREQDGKVFKTRYGGKTKSGVVNRNTMYMVGENGPEMVIDNKAFRKMNPQLRDSLIRELRGIKGFENGYYNPDAMRVEIPDTANISQGELIAAVIQLSSVLDNIQNNGLRAVVSNKDFRSMKNLKDGIKEYENFRNRNKVK